MKQSLSQRRENKKKALNMVLSYYKDKLFEANCKYIAILPRFTLEPAKPIFGPKYECFKLNLGTKYIHYCKMFITSQTVDYESNDETFHSLHFDFNDQNAVVFFEMHNNMPYRMSFDEERMDISGDWKLLTHLLDTLTACFDKPIQAIEQCKENLLRGYPKDNSQPLDQPLAQEIKHTIDQINLIEKQYIERMPKFVEQDHHIEIFDGYCYRSTTLDFIRFDSNVVFITKHNACFCKYTLRYKAPNGQWDFNMVSVGFFENQPNELRYSRPMMVPKSFIPLYGDYTLLRHLMSSLSKVVDPLVKDTPVSNTIENWQQAILNHHKPTVL
jgi:hypothetical protein